MTKIQDPMLSFEEELNMYLAGNSIDCVIFGYEHQELKILLLQWKHHPVWSLPGGFIKKDEDMNEAANRVLIERTGLKSVYLNQFRTFGSVARSELHKNAQFMRLDLFKKSEVFSAKTIAWLTKRFITTGYFALVDIEKTSPKPDFLSAKCEWKSLKDTPPLLLDHNDIVQKALEHLRIRLNYLPIGASLLPHKFTMQDLQKLYEAILQKPLERSNFQRKLLKLDFLNRHEKQMTGAANKAPYLYSFDMIKYEKLIKQGIGFSF